MKHFLTLDDLPAAELAGRRVFVRVDFNVPIAAGKVADATRLEKALPTLHELQSKSARVILAAHRGRPKGEPDPALSLRPVAETLSALLAAPVAWADDCIGPAAQQVCDNLADGEVCLLENLRFHAGEKANDGDFGAALAALAEIFVNDAFGTAHRAHASVVGVAERLPQRAAGRLLAREVEVLGALLGEPRRPFVAVIGGAKIAGKADTLIHLLPRLDTLVLGGAMANTFLAAQGHDMAASLVEEDRVGMARNILAQAEARDTVVLLPRELVVTDDPEEPGRIETVAVEKVPPGMMAVDVGAAFSQRLAAVLRDAGTVFWNGPLGVFEREPFAAGTVAAARALADSPAYTIVGGGETVAAASLGGVCNRFGHVSTGGGAALELLAGKTLPGVAALEVNR
ncbi:MAG: phosphoglycerate kinase [Acidobacteria bacterium]|nr:phosphoglycerate kinase [Acidobacteriota bacterium]